MTPFGQPDLQRASKYTLVLLASLSVWATAATAICGDEGVEGSDSCRCPCDGCDGNGDNTVTVDEVLRVVGYALHGGGGGSPPAACWRAPIITVDVVVSCVDFALRGCRTSSTPSATVTPTSTASPTPAPSFTPNLDPTCGLVRGGSCCPTGRPCFMFDTICVAGICTRCGLYEGDPCCGNFCLGGNCVAGVCRTRVPPESRQKARRLTPWVPRLDS